MPKYTQDNRAIAINTPLGKDELLLKGFRMTEELGRPFRVTLDLRSEKPDIDFNKIIGENVSIRLNLTNGETRYINGFISRFSQEDVPSDGSANKYRAEMVPWLWFLTRTADCKIFQNMKIPDIIKQVFDDAGFTDYELGLSGTYTVKEYVVQYRETSFNFISRLMEHEGIYYFFKHENGKHTLVLADSPSAHEAAPGCEEVKFLANTGASPDFERVWEWQMEKRLQPGKTSLVDFDFKAPSKNLYAEKADPKQHAQADGEIFDYPGAYVETADGTTYTAVRNEELAAQHAVAKAEGDVRGLWSGAKFKLADFPRADQNAEYVCVSASCSANVDEFDTGGGGDEEEMFEIVFTAIPATQQFRPARTTPKPRVGGPQTAIVTGPSGEEIYTDEYGRVKVKFHWDRYSKGDDTSSCWMRVSQYWAGKKWGAIYTPRIGQEVVVDFLEGDPDRPFVAGRVYNGECMPPYALPDNKTISTVKSCSSKQGAGFNELRFEDKKGEEQVFFHAEKNMDVRVKNDYFLTIVHDRHVLVENDAFAHIKHDSHRTVDNDVKTKIGNDHNVEITGKEAVAIQGSKSLTVDGNVIDLFKADHSHSVAAQYSLQADTIVLDAGTNITLVCGGSSIAMDSSSINIKTTTLTIETEGAIEGTSKGTIKFEAKGTADYKATGALTCESSAAATFKAGAAATFEGSAAATLKAGGACTVTGATIAIG